MVGLLPFKRYFEFSGRSGRAEYWQFLAIALVGCIVLTLADMARVGQYGTPYIAFAGMALVLIPFYAVTFRRLHDRDVSGWWLGAQWAINIAGLSLQAAVERDPYSGAAGVFETLRWITVAGNLGITGYLLYHLVGRGDERANRFGPPHEHDGAPDPAPTRHPGAASAGSVAPPSPALAPVSPHVDVLAQIERLAKLRSDGVLTDEEFAQQKAAYLARL